MEKIAPVKGHAFVLTRSSHPYRGYYATCECGWSFTGWSQTGKHARQLHAEHKKTIVREQNR